MKICQGMKIIHSFTAEKETEETFDELLNEHKSSFRSAVRLSDCFGSVIDFSWGFGCVALYFIGIVVLKDENISVGTFWHLEHILICFGSLLII